VTSYLHSESQLKRKIREWNLNKKVKGAEMKAIVRIQQQRAAEGKGTEFRVRDQPVAQAKIDRWQKRTALDNPRRNNVEDSSSRK
jgi:hypothetical protein